MNYKTHQRL